jgi:Holliday junction DNA helicase RuvA
MIAYLKGTVQTISLDHGIIVTADGVGYIVYWHSKTAGQITLNQTIEIYTYHHVSETANDLYGFINLPGLELFKNLISISGIGPKSAMTICGVADVSDIVTAVINNEPALLKGLPGVGAKTAERIVLELKSKIKKLASSDPQASEQIVGIRSGDSDVIDALLSLGYSRQEINNAIKHLDPNISDLGQRIKAMLKLLA